MLHDTYELSNHVDRMRKLYNAVKKLCYAVDFLPRFLHYPRPRVRLEEAPSLHTEKSWPILTQDNWENWADSEEK